MSYTYTEKKRIRKDFSKLPVILETPHLLSIQLESYRRFLRQDASAKERRESGLHKAFRTVFPIENASGNAQLIYEDYELGRPGFDVKECRLRGMSYTAPLRVKLKLVIYDREAGLARRCLRKSGNEMCTWETFR